MKHNRPQNQSICSIRAFKMAQSRIAHHIIIVRSFTYNNIFFFRAKNASSLTFSTVWLLLQLKRTRLSKWLATYWHIQLLYTAPMHPYTHANTYHQRSVRSILVFSAFLCSPFPTRATFCFNWNYVLQTYLPRVLFLFFRPVFPRIQSFFASKYSMGTARRSYRFFFFFYISLFGVNLPCTL